MTSNGFEKFYGYPKNTSWIKIFLFGYIYVGLFGYAAYILNQLSGAAAMASLSEFFQSGIWSYWVVFALLSFLLWLSFVLCGIFLPLINPTGFRLVEVHLLALICYRPLLLLFSWIVGAITKQLILVSVVLFVVSALFAGGNMVYFTERKDLFFESINELIMGVPKDLSKH